MCLLYIHQKISSLTVRKKLILFFREKNKERKTERQKERKKIIQYCQYKHKDERERDYYGAQRRGG